MSHSFNHVDTGPTTHFYQGLDEGIKQERERIIKLLEETISTNGKDSWLDAVQLIKDS